MSINHLMRHRADTVHRPVYTQRTAQEITGWRIVWRNVPCFVQPANSIETQAYAQRGLENVATIYLPGQWDVRREDVITVLGVKHHVVGIVDGLASRIYTQLTCVSYPEGTGRRGVPEPP